MCIEIVDTFSSEINKSSDVFQSDKCSIVKYHNLVNGIPPQYKHEKAD